MLGPGGRCRVAGEGGRGDRALDRACGSDVRAAGLGVRGVRTRVRTLVCTSLVGCCAGGRFTRYASQRRVPLLSFAGSVATVRGVRRDGGALAGPSVQLSYWGRSCRTEALREAHGAKVLDVT
ncbi:hypothetical protein GCM10009760_62630 [Kitasatospora kazusensis]|uniref:Uncharacterized protein n=1 Tax=Kitasatospora kazusensis TaxID=407974 RepID=A0ABP4KG27_9ACTN